MYHYYYQCFDCEQIYQPDVIEDRLIYLCPMCGKAEKNSPIQGVLQVFYEYSLLNDVFTQEMFLEQTPGKISYLRPILPLKLKSKKQDFMNDIAIDAKLSLQNNSVYSIDENLLVLDDTRNFTLSYKDRASILVALKAKELGIDEISCASTGNAGSSIAGICAKLGLKSHIYVPQNIPNAKKVQIESYGANLHVVKGDYDKAFDDCIEISQKKNWYNRNTAYNPLTIEGKKTAAFDIYIQTEGKIPDQIFVPVGDGVIISGLYKGFWELKELGLIKKLPRLIAVQAKGSDAVARYVVKGKFNYKPASTIADSISTGAPRNLYMAAYSIKETKGECITVTDKQILSAQKTLAKEFGILAEPSSAASYAGYLKLLGNETKTKNKIKTKISTLLLITGNGLKDIDSLRN